MGFNWKSTKVLSIIGLQIHSIGCMGRVNWENGNSKFSRPEKLISVKKTIDLNKYISCIKFHGNYIMV